MIHLRKDCILTLWLMFTTIASSLHIYSTFSLLAIFPIIFSVAWSLSISDYSEFYLRCRIIVYHAFRPFRWIGVTWTLNKGLTGKQTLCIDYLRDVTWLVLSERCTTQMDCALFFYLLSYYLRLALLLICCSRFTCSGIIRTNSSHVL